MEIIPDTNGDSTKGTLQFFHGERKIGAAEILFEEEPVEEPIPEEIPTEDPTGEDTKEDPTENPEEQKDPEGTPKKEPAGFRKVLLTILWILLGILVLGAIGYGGYKLYDNFYLIQYKLGLRRQMDIRDAVMRRKRRRRRR